MFYLSYYMYEITILFFKQNNVLEKKERFHLKVKKLAHFLSYFLYFEIALS